MLLKNGKSRPCRTGFSTQFSDKAMTATRRATFKLYPTRVVEVLLLYQRKLDRLFDNACVFHRKTEYQKFGKSVLYSDKPNYLPAFKEQWIDYKNIDFLHAFQGTVGWGSL
jgi:hypothetical protein